MYKNLIFLCISRTICSKISFFYTYHHLSAQKSRFLIHIPINKFFILNPFSYLCAQYFFINPFTNKI